MSSENVIMYMIGFCILFAIIIFFSDKFKSIGKFFFNGIIGSISIYIINYLFSNIGLFVGINLLTFAITGVLGIAGVISLYILNAFL